MSDLAFKVELRKPKSVTAKNWQEEGTYSSMEEAEEVVLWWEGYDKYYSCEGWEYKISVVKARKRR